MQTKFFRMIDIKKLMLSKGNAREILNLSIVRIPWSDLHALGAFGVLRGISFDKFDVKDVEIGLNFVECIFNECRFSKLKTQGHLWAAEDSWNDCVYQD